MKNRRGSFRLTAVSYDSLANGFATFDYPLLPGWRRLATVVEGGGRGHVEHSSMAALNHAGSRVTVTSTVAASARLASR